MALAIQATVYFSVNWVVLHVSVDYADLLCYSGPIALSVVSVYTYLSFKTYLILSLQNEIKNVCLLSAQNEIILSFRTDRILTQNIDAK